LPRLQDDACPGLDGSRIERDALGQRSQRPERLEFPSLVDPDELIGGLADALGLAVINDDTVSVATSRRNEAAGRIEGVAAEEPRMTHERVGSPDDDQVGAILDLAQRAGHLADRLDRGNRRVGVVAARYIDAGANAIPEGDR